MDATIKVKARILVYRERLIESNKEFNQFDAWIPGYTTGCFDSEKIDKQQFEELIDWASGGCEE